MQIFTWTRIFYISLAIIVIFSILSLFFNKSGSWTDLSHDNDDRKIVAADNGRKFESKGEAAARACLEQIFGAKFPNVRLDELKNPVSGKPLELDCYNKDLKIAVEYNGASHYKFNTFFHRSMEDFTKAQDRDVYKAKTCKELGILLITVPYNITLENICGFIRRELTNNGKA
jgi:hypothetical protein